MSAHGSTLKLSINACALPQLTGKHCQAYRFTARPAADPKVSDTQQFKPHSLTIPRPYSLLLWHIYFLCRKYEVDEIDQHTSQK